MSGFPVPAKAKSAGAEASHRSFRARIEAIIGKRPGGPTVLVGAERESWEHDFAEGLKAALPVLAVDPDLIDRHAARLYQRDQLQHFGHPRNWDEETDLHKQSWRDIASTDLRALFGVASPSTKETTCD